MTCPACGHAALTPVDVSGLTVDVCQGGCAGIWFDPKELRALGLFSIRVVGWSVVPWACVCFPDILSAAVGTAGSRR
jgi:hypothetical protein